MRKVLAYSVLLFLGLALSQTLPGLLGGTHDAFAAVIRIAVRVEEHLVRGIIDRPVSAGKDGRLSSVEVSEESHGVGDVQNTVLRQVERETKPSLRAPGVLAPRRAPDLEARAPASGLVPESGIDARVAEDERVALAVGLRIPGIEVRHGDHGLVERAEDDDRLSAVAEEEAIFEVADDRHSVGWIA